ncbi:hypothetical protein D1AOALGA4SA_12275 [Olavius algarvensis Delta 1 endosymbiont]|nr:hypothetical protein D1AOALGA4SA_12275 [Olavius algarvensis Delta 1 endosymbiont]
MPSIFSCFQIVLNNSSFTFLLGVRCQGTEVLSPDTCRRSRLERSESGKHRHLKPNFRNKMV